VDGRTDNDITTCTRQKNCLIEHLVKLSELGRQSMYTLLYVDGRTDSGITKCTRQKNCLIEHLVDVK
jgi:hypothetical protein